jgi:hypothetical protein
MFATMVNPPPHRILSHTHGHHRHNPDSGDSPQGPYNTTDNGQGSVGPAHPGRS